MTDSTKVAGLTDLIALALKCGAFQNDGDHGIPAGTLITFEPDQLAEFVALSTFKAHELIRKWRHAAENLGFEGLASLADCADELQAIFPLRPDEPRALAARSTHP